MVKCLNSRADTGFLPPPGGEQAADRVTSYSEKKAGNFIFSFCKKKVYVNIGFSESTFFLVILFKKTQKQQQKKKH